MVEFLKKRGIELTEVPIPQSIVARRSPGVDSII
jgi:hypothetical protein